MARHRNVDWNLPDSIGWDQVRYALLMDIRDELQALNRIFRCQNFLLIPSKLDAIERNTRKPKRRRRAIAK